MKKIIAIIGAFMLMAAPLTMNADNQKAAKKELDSKSSKTARKEAKKLEKEGWKAAPGALPLEKQLDRSYLKQQEEDELGYPKFLMSEAMSIGENYDAAKAQAYELAKQNLAGQIQTEVTALIENTVANKQLGKEEAASITESVLASKNLISQKIGKTINDELKNVAQLVHSRHRSVFNFVMNVLSVLAAVTVLISAQVIQNSARLSPWLHSTPMLRI